MIYFIEDDANIRKLVCYALSHDGYETRGYAKPSEFYHALQHSLPELILLDIMLPEEDGLSILKKLKQSTRTRDIPIIMLTAKGSEFDKVTGLDLGADDYISKPFGMSELLSRVRAVLRRYEKTSPSTNKIYQLGSLFVDPAKHIIEVNKKSISLSFKEYSLLIMLLQADGNVVERSELLSSIWGDFYDDSRTLDVHIRKLRVKLGDAGSLIRTVKSVGYKIGGEENVQ